MKKVLIPISIVLGSLFALAQTDFQTKLLSSPHHRCYLDHKHVPAFVLTHHSRSPLEMKGGTTFHFVTEGIHSALQRAKAVAKERDVRIGGGVATIQQYLRAGLIDELHLAFRPVLMGSGENLFVGIDLAKLQYRCTEHASTEHAMHVVLTKQT